MGKVFDADKSIYDIVSQDVIAKSIFLELGLKAVATPKAAGAMKARKISDVCPIRGYSAPEVLGIFRSRGYEIINWDGEIADVPAGPIKKKLPF